MKFTTKRDNNHKPCNQLEAVLSNYNADPEADSAAHNAPLMSGWASISIDK